MEATFTTTAYPDKEFRGRLINISAIVDEHTRAAQAVFEVPNPSRELRLGMQANVRLGLGQRAHVLLVPKESILDNEGKKIVYCKRNRSFEAQEVKLRALSEGRAIIEGIQPGTVVALVNPEARGSEKARESGAASNPAIQGGRKCRFARDARGPLRTPGRWHIVSWGRARWRGR